jgi:hypothetical protein
MTYKQLREIIGSYYPNLVLAVEACLSVVGSMAIAGRTKPLSLILEGPSGAGKTEVLKMLFDRKLHDYIQRSDKFTAAAFVTSVGNVAAEQLKGMDLLPKLKNKVLVTKELAPIFRGQQEELEKIFAVLISVLDGDGYVTDTGMRGNRGYAEPILFNWIGATTPISKTTHRVMAQLGTRLLFCELGSFAGPTHDDLLRYALHRGKRSDAGAKCRNAITQFLPDFFARCPIKSVQVDGVNMPPELMSALVRWAILVCTARRVLKYERDGSNLIPVDAEEPEAPWKVIDYLRDLAIGHALITGRMEIDSSDLELIAHIAMSSVPGHLRPLVRHLRVAQSVTSSEARRLCKVSQPTARNCMQELVLLGIAEPATKSRVLEPDSIALVDNFRWLNQKDEKQKGGWDVERT